MSLYPNKRAGKCVTCYAKVGVKEGFISKGDNGGWNVFCNSDKCIPSYLVQAAKDKDRQELTAEGELYFPYDPGALPILRSFPPTKDRSKSTWDAVKKCRNISLQPEDRTRVLELCAQLGITVAAELQTVPEIFGVQDALDRANSVQSLYDFQLAGIEFLASRNKAILADEMGLGKTFSTLLAADAARGLLVVCPNSLKDNWASETRKWRPDLNPVVLEGRQSFRWPQPGEVVILNYEILPKWLMPIKLGTSSKTGRPIHGASVPQTEDNVRMDFKSVTLVVDECQRAKNPKSAVHKKIKELGTLAGRIWFLTGTPVMNKPTELYWLLSAGHMAYDVFGGWKGFVDCFHGTKTGYMGAWEFGMPREDVPGRLRRVMLRRLKKEVWTEMPSVVYRDIVVAPNGARLTKTLDKTWTRFEHLFARGELPRFEELSKVRAQLATSRIPAMLEMVEDFESAGEPLVVFSAYKAPINALAEREGWAIITGDVPTKDRQRIVDDFQAGKLKGIGLTIAAGSTGLTLTRASNLLFVDLDYVPAQNAQAAARVHRISQTVSVTIHRLVSNHPVDIRVHQILEAKMKLIDLALEAEAKYEIKKAPAAFGVRTESQTDFDARMKVAQDAADKVDQDNAKWRFIDSGWTNGVAHRSSRTLVDITPKVATSLRDALDFMLNRCDGANSRDNVGFNKPDAGIARVLATTGLTTNDELRTAERLLSCYHRQLHGKYPELFA